MSIGAGKLMGNSESNMRSADTPPADAAIATISNGVRATVESFEKSGGPNFL